MAEGIKSSIKNAGSGGGGGGSGTVTSVAMTVPSALLSVSGSPVTTNGTFAVALTNHNANLVFAGPASGSAAAPTFRSLVALDIPSLDAAKITTGTLAVARGGTNIGSYTTGDLLYASGATALSKLSVGASPDGYVLTLASGIPTWAAGGGGGGGIGGTVGTTDNAIPRADGTGGSTLQASTWIVDDDNRLTVDFGDTTTGAVYGQLQSITLNSANTITAALRSDITTSGSAGGVFLIGNWLRLLSGYNGGGGTFTQWLINNAQSTGTDPNGGTGNQGQRIAVAGNTTGYNVGSYADVGGGARNWGYLAELESAPNSSSGVNIGFGTSTSPGTGSQISVGHYSKMTASVGGVPNANAAALFDSSSSGFPSLVLQDSSTTNFMIAGGHICTNQFSSGTTPGTIIGFEPRYDATNTLRGYIAIYDTFS